MREPLDIFSRAFVLAAATAFWAVQTAQAQIRVDSRMNTRSGSCAYCDLSGRTMPSMTLRDSNFTGSQFNRSNLSGGNFDNSDLSGTQFKRAFLARVEGTSVNMTKAVFQDATLTEAKFDNATANNSDLRRADLTRAQITRSNFSDANLTSAIAPDVNFEGSKFVNARFDHMNLQNARLNAAIFHNVKFGDAIVTGATMEKADFSNADLSQVQGLSQAQLDSACGDTETRLPLGLSIPYCESAVRPDHDNAMHAGMDPKLEKAAKRLDNAIANIEEILSDTPRDDRRLRRRLRGIHADLTSSRRAIEP
jgi:uncharacterized protein YjbI with pentapeptide repeats